MKGSPVADGLGWILLAAGLAVAGSVAATTAAARPAIPYLATRHDTVRDMPWMADVGRDDVVHGLGGGFCFTLLIGRDEHGVTITEDTGWLIGEGVVDHGELRGTLDFCPWPAGAPPSRPDGAGKTPTEVHQDWAPRPVGP